MNPDDFFIWEGIYPTFEAAPGNTHAFCEEIWLERSRQKMLALRERARSDGYAPVTNTCHEYCLPVIVALAQTELSRVRLLDFGGCVGFSFHSVVDALTRPGDIEYHVVDNASVCRVGREVFRDEPRIAFHSAVPEGQFDVVHLGSSLQYVGDWAAQIGMLIASRPKYLVFDDVPAGSIPTFVSLQNYYGSKIPHWFWNITEFVDTVTRLSGYELFYKARYIGTFLGKSGPVPMGNFPEAHRIDNAYNLAFVRRS